MGSSPGAPSSPDISVANGTFPGDVNGTFRQVQATLGTNVTAPTRVRVVHDRGELRRFLGGDPGRPLAGAPFLRRLGLRNDTVTAYERFRSRRDGYVTGLGAVVLYLAPEVDREAATLLLHHEFVHYVQLQDGTRAAVRAARDRTTDGRFAAASLLEGSAVFATDRALAGNDGEDRPNSAIYRRFREDAPPGHVLRLTALQYLAGRRYVAARAGEPRHISAVVDDPPRTSEQVLHGLDPDREPPAPLSVKLETGENWSYRGEDRVGEAVLRVFLQRGADRDAARAAAAGWGNDTLLTLSRDGAARRNYVWIQRWDDAAEAAAFRPVARAALDARGDRRAWGWSLPVGGASLRRPTPRTTVIVLGGERFRSALRLAVEDATVRVDLGTAPPGAQSGTAGSGEPAGFCRPDPSRATG